MASLNTTEYKIKEACLSIDFCANKVEYFLIEDICNYVTGSTKLVPDNATCVAISPNGLEYLNSSTQIWIEKNMFENETRLIGGKKMKILATASKRYVALPKYFDYTCSIYDYTPVALASLLKNALLLLHGKDEVSILRDLYPDKTFFYLLERNQNQNFLKDKMGFIKKFNEDINTNIKKLIKTYEYSKNN